MNLLPSVKNLSLILYVQVFIPGYGMSISVNLFLDFIELEDVTEKENFRSRFQHLQPLGMTEHYISKHLVSAACNCAAVMLRNRSGVQKLMEERLPLLLYT
jgi:hypothetical protein